MYSVIRYNKTQDVIDRYCMYNVYNSATYETQHWYL